MLDGRYHKGKPQQVFRPEDCLTTTVKHSFSHIIFAICRQTKTEASLKIYLARKQTEKALGAQYLVEETGYITIAQAGLPDGTLRRVFKTYNHHRDGSNYPLMKTPDAIRGYSGKHHKRGSHVPPSITFRIASGLTHLSIFSN